MEPTYDQLPKWHSSYPVRSDELRTELNSFMFILANFCLFEDNTVMAGGMFIALYVVMVVTYDFDFSVTYN